MHMLMIQSRLRETFGGFFSINKGFVQFRDGVRLQQAATQRPGHVSQDCNKVRTNLSKLGNWVTKAVLPV